MAQSSEQSIWMRVFAQAADIIVMVTSFAAAFQLRAQIRTIWFFGTALSLKDYYSVLALCVAVWWFCLYIQKAYADKRRASLGQDLKIVLKAAVFGTIALLVLQYLIRTEVPPRSAIALFVVINTALLTLNRIFFALLREFLRQEGALSKTVLIVGAGERAQRFLRSLWNHSEWNTNPVGFIGFDPSMTGSEVMGAQVLGAPGDLLSILHSYSIDEVIFAVPSRQLENCTEMLFQCEQEGVNAVILSDFFSSLLSQVETEILYDQPALVYRTTRHKDWQLLVKRAFDIAFSGLLLLILSPLLLLIALLIKLQDGGPVLYKQRRAGQNWRIFSFTKFRTMVVDADKRRAELQSRNEMSGVVFKIKDDPRITRLGRILRKYSLDELPQLWSVFIGQMSVVGPRPPLESELRQFESWHRRKLSVKPGLTCLWQISGRNEITDFDEWVRLDLAYIDKWSLWLDFKILLKTVPVVLIGRGAV